MEKYSGRMEAMRPVRIAGRKRKQPTLRNKMTQEEHDRIYRAYHDGHAPQTVLAARFGRSQSLICTIVNGRHKFFTHDKKTD